MNSNEKKRLISLLLVVCMLVGILAILPIRIPVSAAIDTNGNHFFKVGSKFTLTGVSTTTGSGCDEVTVTTNTRKELTEAPFEYNGEVYIPVSALTVAGLNASSSETVNGISAVKLANMYSSTGMYASISNMNLIAISTTQNFFSNHTDEEQVELMKKFLFDGIDASNNSFTQGNPFDVNDMKSLDHPYLYANQAKFDELAAVYAAGEAGQDVDEVLYAYIKNRVDAGVKIYDQYAKVDANGHYTGMNTTVGLTRGHQDYIFEIPFQTTGSGSNDGYDAGGRNGEAQYSNERIMQLAFAYQITGNIDYAKLAYQFAIYIGQWEHWGPGHFLNVADSAAPYAVAYDWLYDAWAELAEQGATYLYFNGTYASGVPQFETRTVSLAAIEEVIFTHALYPGYLNFNATENKNSLPWWSNVVGEGWHYHTRENNWNAVCAAGMTVAALALVGSTTSTSGIKIDNTIDGVYNATIPITNYGGSHSGMSTYQDYAEYLVNQNVYYLPLYGLKQYMPYGDYIESNGYWSYGTNNLYEMAAALTSATGSHYGLLDAWGMDKTALYALNTMSSDGLSYNYHDSNTITAQDTSWFMYLGHAEGQGNKALAGIRKDLNATIAKQQPSYYDIIYYMSDEEIGEFEYPELQYYMAGIDGYVMRDSWNAEEGSMFAGFMGESNTGDHTQVDSGAFVYYNKGTRWFCDLGTENYNAYNFWNQPYRARYYAMGPEGNNTVILKGHESTTFFGQWLNGSGEITKTGSNAYGSYAVLDNTTAYQTSSLTSGKLATSALRGMFHTNDRKTFVIQDQMTFKSAEDVAWVGHIVPEVEVMLSVDKTVAYLSDGKTVIKATIIDPDGAGLTFRHAYCTDDEFLLNNTQKYNFSVSNKDETPNTDYSDYQKLIIEKDDVTKFNVAVVIEEVVLGETMNDAEGIGYTWTDMNSWTPYKDERGGDGDDGDGDDGVQGPVATITVTVLEEDNELDPDTPVVDLWGMARAIAAPIASSRAVVPGETTVYTAYSFAELQNYINLNKGSLIVVELAASNDTPITIDAPCTVNTNGNTLLATSTSYIAAVSGDTVEYKKGTVTVKWVLANGSTVTESYTGASVAKYKGNITEGGLYEVDNGDGTYSYYHGGNAWALSKGGEQASSDDLIVTSANCTFYQTDIKYEGLFVGVANNGTITGYTKADDFFSSTFRNTAYERISVTNDFSYDATAKSDFHNVTRTMNIYLNGYTVTYTSADTSDHMFMPQTSGVSLNIYGPGAMRNEAAGSNFISGAHDKGATVLVENVEIYSTRGVIDHRYGTATFRNCNITIETNTLAFGVHNRNNQAGVMPYLIVDGCVVNMPATTSNTIPVVEMINNVKAEVTGGTSIIASSAIPLFAIRTQIQGAATEAHPKLFDYYTGSDNAQAIMGEFYFDCNTIAIFTSTHATNAATHGTCDGEGKCDCYASDANVYLGNTYMSDSNSYDYEVLPGYVFAKTGESSYIVTPISDCAFVSWKNGSTTVASEYWYKGSTPVAGADVKSKISVASGKMVSFTTEPVSAGADVSFSAVVIDAFALKVNMSLQTDFHLNFFIENIGQMTFKIDGVEVKPDTASMPGYYKVAKTSINPANAGKAVKLEVTYGGVTVTKTISPIDYARKILADGTQSAETKAMMINIVKYIDAAYVYVGNNVGSTAPEYSLINALYKDYKSLATVSVVNRQPVDTSAISDAIRGAQFELADSPRIRFNLKSTYSGTVTVNGNDYTVTSGICGGSSYIEITYKAFDLLDVITIKTTGEAVEYSLANYYHFYATEQGALTNLLNALYAYCETARIYQNSL